MVRPERKRYADLRSMTSMEAELRAYHRPARNDAQRSKDSTDGQNGAQSQRSPGNESLVDRSVVLSTFYPSQRSQFGKHRYLTKGARVSLANTGPPNLLSVR